jgi:hypothetical protein
MATANPSRMYIPDEYVLTGTSAKDSSSANEMISSMCSSTYERLSP